MEYAYSKEKVNLLKIFNSLKRSRILRFNVEKRPISWLLTSNLMNRA